MFAQLGKIQFSTLKTFGSKSERGSAIYAEHAMLDGKPKLQRTGVSLTELSISIYFHHSFCNPKEELAALKAARDNGEVLPLLWGNGEVEGDFVLVDMDATTEEAATEGTVLSYTVELTLKEYVSSNKLQQEQADNRANAKAVGDKKPVAQTKENSPTCPQMVSGLVSRIKSHAAVVEKVFSTDGGPNTVDQKANVKRNLTATIKLCDTISQKSTTPEGSCLVDNPGVKTKAADLKAEAAKLSSQIGTQTNALLLFGEQYTFQTKVKDLDRAARKLMHQTITRN